ncbi:unnamed protein product [Hermetia illucens]|uniref:Uncharacterized protein n=1 Tax=Hermetia illucens TaxID=343691 RepID=A0A7R8UP33_HERIL|nr:unnamed protein product [Hermetia illucens]
MSDSTLYIINIQFCNSVSQPIVENTVTNTWSPEETEFHDTHVGLEIARRSPFRLLMPSYWLMRSKDLSHFTFKNGRYDNVLLILGESEIYWHATNKSGGDTSDCLSGSTAAKICLRKDEDAVKQIENILRFIYTSK